MNKRQIRKNARELIQWAKDNKDSAELVDPGFMEDESHLSLYLGNVFSIMPSGKYYMPWTTNQTERDVYEDEIMNESLEYYARKIGAWLESGEGDPCDVFVCWTVEE